MSNRRIISVSDANYLALKRLGMAGDSFNDVLTQILNKIKPQQTEIRVGTRDSVCGGCTVDTGHPQGDGLNR
jgi:predicted CopG family antitoxin